MVGGCVARRAFCQADLPSETSHRSSVPNDSRSAWRRSHSAGGPREFVTWAMISFVPVRSSPVTSTIEGDFQFLPASSKWPGFCPLMTTAALLNVRNVRVALAGGALNVKLHRKTAHIGTACCATTSGGLG